MKARTGSILMETVIVLPLWLTVFAGILRLGERGIDYLRLKEADRTVALIAASRSGGRKPAPYLVRLFFSEGAMRSPTPLSSAQLALADTKSWTMMAGAGARLPIESRYVFWDDMFNAVSTVWGGGGWLPDLGRISSSRKGKDRTWFCLAPSKNSFNTRRHWDASLIVKHDIWKFKGEDDDVEYPAGGKKAGRSGNWDEKFFKGAKRKDDGMRWRNEPEPVKIYERYKRFVEWSES